MNINMVWRAVILGCVTFAGNSIAGPASAPGANHSAWTISASPSVRQIHRVSFDTAAVLQGGSQRIFSGRAASGAADSFDDRTYENGFVNIDIATLLDNRTWNWGYDDAAQVGGGNLNFQSTDSRRMITEVTGAAGSGSNNDDMEAGVRLTAERPVWQRGKLSAMVLCGLDYTRISAGNSIQGTFRQWRQDRIIVDSYALGATKPPTPPYEGSFSVPGPLIDNIPTTRTTYINTQPAGGGPLMISDSLDADVITASLGLALRGQVGWLRIGGAVGPSVSLIPLTAEHVETCAAASWDSRSSETDTAVEPGLFGQADLDVTLHKNIGVRLTGRYDWINEISGDVGPSSYAVDVSGFSLSCGLYVDL